MKKYPEYKDSGIEWIGEIPEHWDISKLKRVTKFKYGDSLSNENRIDGNIPVYGSNGIVGFHKEAIANAPCIIIGRKGSFGKINFSDIECFPIDTTFFVDSTATHNNIKWIYYLLTTLHLDSFSKDSAVPGLSREEAYEKVIPFPQPVEQKQIANYLDQKTKQIDTLIEKKQKLIELLKEKRNAIINQAVTKGLDLNVPMKDSGIEWLGEIPGHWEVKQLKFLKSKDKYAFVDGPFGSNLKSIHFVDNGEVYVIESGFITSGEFKSKEFKTITREHFETIKRSECKANDIIIAKIGANFGMSGILPELYKDAVVSGNSLKLTVDTDKNLTEFIHYQLLSLKFKGAFDLLVNMTAQPALSLQALNNLHFAVPQTEEQKSIVLYLNEKLNFIDMSILSIQNQIQLYKEYRTTLISEVVTGKIDVRNEVES